MSIQQSWWKKMDNQTELLRETKNILNLVVPIVGKVIADDLMPDIAAPGYPQKVLDNINSLLAKIDANGTA